MYLLTVRRFLRQFENDNRSVIETVYCYDSQLGNWLAKPKTFDYELLSWRHID